MSREVLAIQFPYSAGILQKRKRTEQIVVLSDSCSVAIERVEPEQAAPVAAVWRPRPNELDGLPVEFRKDALGFLTPLFPARPKSDPARLRLPEFLECLAGDGWQSRFSWHPLTQQMASRYAETKTAADLPEHRRVWDRRDEMEELIQRTAARYCIVGDQVYERTREPAIHLTWAMAPGGDSHPIFTVDMDSAGCEFMRGSNLFRLTSTARAMEAGVAAARSKSPIPTLPDIEILRPSAFEMDDETPRICGDLVDAAEDYVRQDRRQRPDPEYDELYSMVFARNSMNERKRVMWDDARLPRIAEMLGNALAAGKVGEKLRPEVVRVLEMWAIRPHDAAADAVVGDGQVDLSEFAA